MEENGDEQHGPPVDDEVHVHVVVVVDGGQEPQQPVSPCPVSLTTSPTPITISSLATGSLGATKQPGPPTKDLF